MTGTFDVQSFLSQTTEEAGNTSYTPLPECQSLASVDKLDVRALSDGKVVCDITWLILDEEVKTKSGLEKPTVRQGVFLDLDASGRLAWGQNKNITLGMVRQAVGQNNPGQAWGLNQLLGQVAKINVTQRPGTKPEDIAIGRIYNDVKGVVAAS